MRDKLATIQTILDIQPIPNADKIEVAKVLGWEVVINKNEFKIGDKVVYIEIDSILPPKPEFEFLKDRKYRIRTIKLKKQISQGICFPISILPENKYSIGQDVTDIIGVKKYDPEALVENENFDDNKQRRLNWIDNIFKRYKWYRKLFLKSSKKKYPWPEFIAKTDEERIQNMPDICEIFKNIKFSTTEKLDGTSFTCFIKRQKSKLFFTKYQFGVCSRTLQRPENSNCIYWKIFEKYNLKDILINMFEQRKKQIDNLDNIVIQGEILGPKIQGNKYQLKENQLYIFNIKINGQLLSNEQIQKLCNIYNLQSVPMLQNDFELKSTVADNVELSKGISRINPDVPREGLVVRDNCYISFKIVNPEFLLKFKE